MDTDIMGETFGMCNEIDPFLLLRFTIFGFLIRVIRFSKDTLMEASSTGAVLVSFKGITHDVRGNNHRLHRNFSSINNLVWD
jgi:hypothetical protein